MSANNWDICPRCKQRAEAKHAKAKKDIQKSYGKVTPEEYQRRLDAVREPPELEETLREDWELGMEDDGRFHVGYFASCQDCGLEFQYKHEEKVDLEKASGRPD